MTNNLENVTPDTLNTNEEESFYSIKPDKSTCKLNENILTEALQNELRTNKQNPESSNSSEICISTTPGVCRICLQTDLDESNKCITPCFCRGSMSKVHRKCLETWLAQSESDDCEICKFKYKTLRITKYSLLGSIKAWLVGNETRAEIKELWHDGLVWFPITFVMILLSYSGFYITEQTFNTEIPIEYDATYQVMTFGACTIIMCADFFFGLWTSYRIQYHISHWFSFYKRSQRVVVIDQKFQETSS